MGEHYLRAHHLNRISLLMEGTELVNRFPHRLKEMEGESKNEKIAIGVAKLTCNAAILRKGTEEDDNYRLEVVGETDEEANTAMRRFAGFYEDLLDANGDDILVLGVKPDRICAGCHASVEQGKEAAPHCLRYGYLMENGADAAALFNFVGLAKQINVPVEPVKLETLACIELARIETTVGSMRQVVRYGLESRVRSDKLQNHVYKHGFETAYQGMWKELENAGINWMDLVWR